MSQLPNIKISGASLISSGQLNAQLNTITGWSTGTLSNTASLQATTHYCTECHPQKNPALYISKGDSLCEECFSGKKKRKKELMDTLESASNL